MTDRTSKQQVGSALEILRGSGMLQAVKTVHDEILRLNLECADLAATKMELQELLRQRAVETPAEPDQHSLCVCGHKVMDHVCTVSTCDCGYFEPATPPKTSGDSHG